MDDNERFKVNKKWLNRYLVQQGRINYLTDRHQELRAYLHSKGIKCIENINEGRLIDYDRKAIDEYDLRERLNRIHAKQRMIKDELLTAIGILDVKQAQVLTGIFIDGLSKGELAEQMGYSERYIQRIYSKSVKNISI